jgi:hypothetical protein
MASEQSSEKSNATPRKPERDQRAPAPSPQVRSPLFNDGPELVRDSHT